MSADWYEVWADEALPFPYLLLVMPSQGGGTGVVVIDPKEGNRVVCSSADYDAAKLWLLEDEYHRVDGRMTAN
jgi:hypothetical protein